MNSPVKINFSSFIKIDRQHQDPIYLQIVYQFINAVRQHLLEHDDQLPGSRLIAKDLQVHRKTLIAAFDELQQQGWLLTQPSVGTFVQNPELNVSSHKTIQPPQHAPFNFRRNFVLDLPEKGLKTSHYFTEGTPDHRLIKVEELTRTYAAVLKRKIDKNQSETSQKAADFFQNQLSYYLNLTRRIRISRHHLLAVAQHEHLFLILAQLLLKTGDVVLVGAQSYYRANMIFNQAGVQLKTIPVDDEGLCIEQIKQGFKPGEIRCIYLNSRAQYPTTVILSDKRRRELLSLAQHYRFLIIEDDSDYEFRLSRQQPSSLFRQDGGQQVIYISAFGRYLPIGFQRYFMLGPEDFINEAKKYLNFYGKPDSMINKSLGELIHQGDIHRYRRKNQQLITDRSELFAAALSHIFKTEISFSIPIAGLAFWVIFKASFSLIHLQKIAHDLGLIIPSSCLYQDKNTTALRLGFAHLNKEEMIDNLQLLHCAYDTLQKSHLTE